VTGILLFVVILALAIEVGRLLCSRLLGEREPLAVAGYSLVLGLGAIVLPANLIYRTTLRVGLVAPLLLVLLLVARTALVRATRGASHPDAGDAPPPLPLRAHLLVVALVALATLPMALVLFRNHLWDEWEAHMPLATSMAHGVYPLVYPYLPDFHFTYHFGYDLLAALAHRLTGLRIDREFDCQSTVMFVAYILVCGSFLRRQVGGRVLPYALACAVAWAGGLTWMRAFFPTDLSSARLEMLVGWGRLDGYPPLPPPPSYFMQKPMALGLPVWITTLALFLQADRRKSIRLGAAAGVCLGFLELSQFALFCVTLATALAYAALGPALERRARGRTPAIVAVFVGVGLAVGVLNGGFLANPAGHGLEMIVQPSFPYFQGHAEHGSPLSPYVWQLGLPIVLLPLAAAYAWRARKPHAVWLLALAGGSLLLPHVIRYPHSNDVQKFFVVSVIASALLLSCAVIAIASRRPRWVGFPLIGLFVLGLTGSAPLWILAFLRDTPRWEGARNNPDVEIDAEVAAWLRPRVQPYDRVLTSSIYPAAFGGFLTPVPTFYGMMRTQLDLHGYDRTWIKYVADAVDRAMKTLDAEDLAKLGVRWLIFDEHDLANLTPEARAQLEEDPKRFRLAHEARRGPQLRLVFEYLAGPPPK
jgi:hypothetical protein